MQIKQMTHSDWAEQLDIVLLLNKAKKGLPHANICSTADSQEKERTLLISGTRFIIFGCWPTAEIKQGVVCISVKITVMTKYKVFFVLS